MLLLFLLAAAAAAAGGGRGDDLCSLKVEMDALTLSVPSKASAEAVREFAKKLSGMKGIGCDGSETCIVNALERALKARRESCDPVLEGQRFAEIARLARLAAVDLSLPSTEEEDQEEESVEKLVEDFDLVDLSVIERLTSELDFAVSGLAMEGHSGDLLRQRKLYAKVAAWPRIKHICEIGFNVGHSALVWLASNPEAKVVSFDFFDTRGGRLGFDFLKERFGERLTIVKGPSSVTAPAFAEAAESTGFKCDLLVVDGGHGLEDAESDLRAMRRLANPKNHLLFIDDIFCQSYHCIGPTKAANDLRAKGALSDPIVQFTEHDGLTDDARGIALFRFLGLSPPS